MEQKVEKLAKLGSAISSWKSILLSIIILIASLTTLYYQIQGNSTTNIKQDVELKDYQKAVDREFENVGSIADKRYIRAMEESVELHQKNRDQDEKILELYKEVYYQKGKMDEMNK